MRLRGDERNGDGDPCGDERDCFTGSHRRFWLSSSIRDRLRVTTPEVDMPSAARSKRSREKVKAHRERLRRQGLRPIQIWVPDVRSPAFAAEARRQSLAVPESPHARADQDFVDAVSDWSA
jgi:hypothetical protein